MSVRNLFKVGRGSFLLILVAAFVQSAGIASATTGELTHTASPSPNGCFDNDTMLNCAGPLVNADALGHTTAVAISPDGTSLYATGGARNSLISTQRNTSTALLTQFKGGCHVDTVTAPSFSACTSTINLKEPTDVAVSPDGLNVYVVAHTSDSILVFSRNTSTGFLTLLTTGSMTTGCINDTSAGCDDGNTSLDGVISVAVSADGKNVYTAGDAGVAVFDRDASDGGLSVPAGTNDCVVRGGRAGDCLSVRSVFQSTDITVSPEDDQVLVTSAGSDAVTVLNRSATTGYLSVPSFTPCVSEDSNGPSVAGGLTDISCLSSEAPSLVDLNGVAISSDGAQVAVASAANDAVSIFDRDNDTSSSTYGQLTQQAPGETPCISNAAITNCTVSTVPMVDPNKLAYSIDGENLYWVNSGSNSIVAASRDITTGDVTLLDLPDTCDDDNGGHSASCVLARVMRHANNLAISPDDQFVHVAAWGDGTIPIGGQVDDTNDPRGSVVAFGRELPVPPPPTTTTTTTETTTTSTTTTAPTVTSESTTVPTTTTTTDPTDVCTSFVEARRYSEASKWVTLPGSLGRRLRMESQAGTYVSSKDAKLATFKLKTRRILSDIRGGSKSKKKRGKIDHIDWYLDDVFQATSEKDLSFQVDPSSISDGKHTITAKVYVTKSSKVSSVSLRFVNGLCKPLSGLSYSNQFRGENKPTNIWMSVNAGDTVLTSATFTLPTRVSIYAKKIKKQRGKKIGYFNIKTTDGKSYKGSLKVPKSFKGKTGEVVTLSSASDSSPEVTLEVKNGGEFKVTGLPANSSAVKVSLNGRFPRFLINTSVGTTEVSALLTSATDSITIKNTRLKITAKKKK